MATFTDWLAATFYTSPEDVQTHQDVAAAQQQLLDQQLNSGKIGAYDYLKTSQDVQDAGNYTADFKASNSGFFSLLTTIPFWVWLIGVGALFVWLGGLSLLKGVLKK